MKPILFSIGSYAFSSYYIFISLGICLGLIFFYRYGKKSGLPPLVIIDIGLIVTITCYIGARLFHVVFEMPGYYIKNPMDILAFWKGGYVFYGGVLFPLLFIYLYARKKKLNFLSITDILAPSVAIGTALGRIACLLQGCCFGRSTGLPWGIIFPMSTPPPTPPGILLHPTQIYLSLNSLIIFFILSWRFSRKKFDGELTYLYLLLYGVGRSIIEFYRGDFRGNLFEPYLSTSQFVSILIVMFCAVQLIRNYTKYRNRA